MRNLKKLNLVLRNLDLMSRIQMKKVELMQTKELQQ